MKRILAVIAAVTVLSLQAAAQNNAPDAGALISEATKAMGTTSGEPARTSENVTCAPLK